MSTDDEDALSWAGDDVPATEVSRGTRPAGERNHAVTAEPAEGNGAASRHDIDRGPASGETGSLVLVLLGLLGGAHLLYSVGWVLAIGPLQASFRPVDLLGTAMFSLGLVAAAASPVVWFVSVFWFTRSRPSWQRIAALVVGVLLLVPWPFVVGVR
ncbi:hypothetical protein ELQ92_08625 [Labedella populi]|uniref:DNA polymerase III subunit gamma/tau n=1 Tax=Labedella populi TaxID=2498850 RepID=A0A3S4C1W9_9MICO|nr:hypothetical protein [Labedella populi]RWZ61101.1 hypothetical protein ELQ92_08625 [Labedella populi]